MMTITLLKLVLSIVILLLAFPTGMFLARLCRDELKAGKKWFKLIIIVFSLGFLISLFLKRFEIALTCAFTVSMFSVMLRS